MPLDIQFTQDDFNKAVANTRLFNPAFQYNLEFLRAIFADTFNESVRQINIYSASTDFLNYLTSIIYDTIRGDDIFLRTYLLPTLWPYIQSLYSSEIPINELKRDDCILHNMGYYMRLAMDRRQHQKPQKSAAAKSKEAAAATPSSRAAVAAPSSGAVKSSSFKNSKKPKAATAATTATAATPSSRAAGPFRPTANKMFEYDEIKSYSVPPPSGRGGSRRRRRTAHKKRKGHRKSKRVHHTRRKHTRRHRHSRRH